MLGWSREGNRRNSGTLEEDHTKQTKQRQSSSHRRCRMQDLTANVPVWTGIVSCVKSFTFPKATGATGQLLWEEQHNSTSVFESLLPWGRDSGPEWRDCLGGHFGEGKGTEMRTWVSELGTPSLLFSSHWVSSLCPVCGEGWEHCLCRSCHPHYWLEVKWFLVISVPALVGYTHKRSENGQLGAHNHVG